ncbi:MAG: hypothetical protein IPM46_00895 [Flavobacteriales bacterium]|nr:hypothetical protein [Flavobacteriales bacterium]
MTLNIVAGYFWWKSRQARQSVDGSRQSRVEARAELLDQLPIDTGDVVLLGDSHFENLPIGELFPSARIRNRGMSGQTTAGALARCGPLLRSRPTRVIILLGANDVVRGTGLNSQMRSMSALIDSLAGHEIATALVSVPPNTDPRVQARIEERNQAVRQLAQERGLPFIELDAMLKRDGVLDPSLTFDGLHLNARGSRILADALAPHLQ